MATRLYFTLTAFSGLTPSYDSGWNYTSEAGRYQLTRAKYSSPSSITAGTQIGAWTATAGQSALDRQYISAPLAAQTISGTLSCMLMTREFNATDNVDRPHMAVKVINSSGTVVATLLSKGAQTGSSTGEFNTAMRTQTFASAASLSSYSCSAGDRLLVEIGYSNSTAGTSPEAAANWGENATDATLGDNATTASRAGWIEFSGNLTWAAPTVTGCSPDNGGSGGGKTITVTGTNFVQGATVAIGSNSATSVAVTSLTTLTCVTPAGSVGDEDIVVTNPDSLTGTLVDGYTYNPPEPTEAVFIAAGGSQIVLYEAYGETTAGSLVDTMGVGSTFNQPNAANRPLVDRTLAPSRKTMLSYDGVDDMIGDFGTGGIIATGSFPTWASPNIVVEHFVIVLPATPDNSTVMMMIDLDSDGWNRNQFGSGVIYRTGANSNGALSGATPYFITCEHNCSTGVSTMTINGVAQTTTGTNSGSTRTDFLNYKLIGAKGDLSDPFHGHIGGYGIGYGTTWGSTERAALYQAMQDWWNDAPTNNPIPAPVDVLGSRLKRFYHRFSNATRTWTDDILFVSATQSTAGNTPADEALDSGFVAPNFDGNATGSAADYMTAAGIAELATHNSTGYYLWFGLLQCDALGPDGQNIVLRMNGTGLDQIIINTSGKVEVRGNAGTACEGNSSIVNDGVLHRVIVMCNAASGALQLWIDGTLQTTAGAGSDFGKEWKATSQEIGARSNGSGDYRYKGVMAAVGFAFDVSSFSGDISDLDDALVEYRDGTPGGASYTLTATPTLFGFTGRAAGLTVARFLTATRAQWGFSAPATNLLHGYPNLVASRQTMGFTGSVATLLSSRHLGAQQQAIGFSGRPATMLAARTLPASSKAFGFSGPPAALSFGHALVASSQAIGVTGAAVSFQRGLKLAATSSSLSFTGNAANLRRGYYMIATSAAIAFTPSTTGLKRALVMAAATASIALTANAAGLFHGFRLTATSASIAFTGNDAALNPGSGNRTLTATAASIAFTGRATSFARALQMTAAQQAISFTGQASYRLVTMPAASASIAFTGRTTNLTRALRMTADAQAASFTGRDAALSRSLRMAATSSSLSFGGQPALFLRGYYLGATQAALSFTGRAAALSRAARLAATSASLSFTGTDTALLYSASFHTLHAETQAIPFVGYDVELAYFRPHILRIAWTQKPAARITFTQKPAGRIVFEQKPAARIVWRRAMSTPLNVNDTNRIDFTFYDTDNDEEPADPTTLSAVVVSPSGVRTTYTLGTDGEWQKLATGVYRLSILCTEPKTWSWTVTAAGNVKGVESSSFTVNRNA